MSKSETDALKDKVCTFTGVYFSGAQNISSEIFISESNKARQQFQTAELHYLYRVFLFLFSRWLPSFWPELINQQYLTMVSGGTMAKDRSWWASLNVATPSWTIRGFIIVAAGCFVLLMAVPMGWYSSSSSMETENITPQRPSGCQWEVSHGLCRPLVCLKNPVQLIFLFKLRHQALVLSYGPRATGSRAGCMGMQGWCF